MLCSDCLLVPLTILHCMTTFNGYIIHILRQVGKKSNLEIFKHVFEIFLSYILCELLQLHTNELIHAFELLC